LTEPAAQSSAEGAAPLSRNLRAPLMLGGLAIVVLAALIAWLLGGRYQSTDDAYVRVAGVEISANIAGRVTEVNVQENQRVREGQVLFRLDPAPHEIAVEEARAGLADARQQLKAQIATYRQLQAELGSAQDAAAYRERESQREESLMQAGAVSKSEHDEASHEAESARLRVMAVREQLAAALARLGGRTDADVESHPEVRAARSQLDRAKLQQSWTVVSAPQAGRVTKVEQLQVGDYINAAAPVFHLVADRVWIEASFKENQLRYMHPGQPATVKVDAYPAKTYRAVVQSVAPGTDQIFSLLPAENGSGNWVKVVQRLPVRIVFEDAPPKDLQGGLSVRVKVDTNHRRFGGGRGG
jgi:membrane fusion protein (multidrug efflux system)